MGNPVADSASYAPAHHYILFELQVTEARCNGYGDVVSCRRPAGGRSPGRFVKAWKSVQELVFHGVNGCACPRGDADLGVDVLDVAADGFR